MHIPTFVFIFILFRKNILLLLLYPKHVIKLLGYNLGCYMVDILMLRSPIFEVLYSPELDFRIFVWPVCSSLC